MCATLLQIGNLNTTPFRILSDSKLHLASLPDSEAGAWLGSLWPLSLKCSLPRQGNEGNQSPLANLCSPGLND